MIVQPTDQLINQLVRHRARATGEQLATIIERVGKAEFTEALLEVESALWGSFWQFDVIAPGSQLPAVEVALLRAMRLDQSWSEGTTVEQFLADVQQAIRQRRVGAWTLEVIGEPTVVVASYENVSTTVVWYCAATGHLHAAYRTASAGFSTPPEAIKQSALPLVNTASPKNRNRVDWLAAVIEEKREYPPQDLATRLDVAILALRWNYF